MTVQGAFYTYRYQGFHGYEMLYVHPKKEYETPEHMRQQLEHLLHEAYTRPTFQKVLAYLKLQKRHMAKSHRFARMWERVLWAHPDLDERSHMPVTHPGISLYREEKMLTTADFLKKKAANYWLCVVVDDRSYSRTFMEVMDRFGQEYGWDVRYISAYHIHEKTNVLVDPAAVRALEVSVYPALFIMHRHRPEMMRLGAGCMSMSAVVYRVKESLHDVMDTHSAV